MSATSRASRHPHPHALSRTALSRIAFVSATAAASIALLATPAMAHITVAPDSAQPGSAAVLTFHIPNEEATADTTRVDMQIPTDHPIAQLLVEPVPGWTVSVRTVTLAKPLVTDDGQFNQAISEIIWSGGKIAPGQFQDFSVSADPLPEHVSQLTFKTIQTYSNGDVVRWIDVSQPGQPEPDHPAPVLALTATTGTGTNTAAAPPTTTGATATATSSPDTMTRAIALAGLACGLVALALSALSRRRRATSVPTPTPTLTPSSAPIPAPTPSPAAGSRHNRTRR